MEKRIALTVDLPEQLVRTLEQRVAEGEYASASDIIIEALTVQQMGDAAKAEIPEDWLTDVVLPAFDGSDDGSVLSAEETAASLDRHMDEAIRRHKKRA